MKRSEINKFITEAKKIFADHGFTLPPFAYWTPEEWRHKGAEADEIRDNTLGWDVTDFGQGDFLRWGLLLFTIRNGNSRRPDRYPKQYAEKIMIVKEGQMTPLHFHWKKREDIINRAGGELVFEAFKAAADESLSDERFTLSMDGIRREFGPGGRFSLAPGMSVTFEPYTYHLFYAAPGKGSVVVGEVSAVNDDQEDNRFYEPMGRFPVIDEDTPPVHLLCREYPPPA
ncbi:MAG: D-lyxose/D-mannose family sugar isomerase [Ignavibacteria bacterium]|nr:D-lyxose/D-mannose family sugar isomerase [Ignavibacteria bacterium]